MSYNRGIKRDSYGNRNNNNRMSGGGGGAGGGGGGGGGGNRGGNMNLGMGNMMGGGGGGGGGGNNNSGGGGGCGGGGMNPWESGMMPGRGILPTPNNNLSLASPQAQLAIASNLISNLLRTQQDPQPQVPSLLSLGNNYGNPGPNYGHQQNFSPGRMMDRPGRNQMKNQRSQPYNKMGNRARDGPGGRRGQSAQQSRMSGNQRMNGGQRNDKSSKQTPKQNQSAKKEQQDVKTSDKDKAETPVLKSEIVEESGDTKREWKDEKKGDTIQGTAFDESKNVDNVSGKKETSNDLKKKQAPADKETKTSGRKSEVRHAESRYAEVPLSQMFCHICNKHMWDGSSFENHLRGRAHQLMMDKLDESYKLKVDLMRHELRVAEEQRELTLNNSKRRGKKLSVDLNVREYCPMCDLNFYGTLSTHRKSEKHQQLKIFLHPRCFPCVKEFPSRIEYNEHCLTPSHMKNVVQVEEQRKHKKKDKLAKGEIEVRSAEDEEKDTSPPVQEQKTNEEVVVEEEEEEGGGGGGDEQDYTIDTKDLTINQKVKIPSHKYIRQKQIQIGKSMVKTVEGFYCEKCRKFMLLTEDMNAHLRSYGHYRNFVQEVEALTTPTESILAEELNQTVEETEQNKSINNEEYEGDWKRRKIALSEDEDGLNKTKDTDNTLDTTTNDGDAEYDPLKVDAESEDANTNLETKLPSQNNDNVEHVNDTSMDTDRDNDIEIGNSIDENDEKKTPNENDNLVKTDNVQIDQTKLSPLPTPMTTRTGGGVGIGGMNRNFNRGRGGPRARRAKR